MNEIFCLIFWGKFRNLRFEFVHDTFNSEINFYKIKITHIKYIRTIQFRLYMYLKKRIYGYCIPRLCKKYKRAYVVDIDQLPYMSGVKIIIDMDDPTFSDREIKLLKQTSNIEKIIVTTEEARKKFVELGITTEILVIHQAVDFPCTNRMSKNDKIVIGYCAPSLSLSTDKNLERYRNGLDNLDVLFEAISLLDSDIQNMIEVHLVGTYSKGIQKLSTQYHWIKLHGLVDSSEIFKYVNTFDIGVYPRTTILPVGRFSIKIAQLMSMGIPIVANNLNETQIIREIGCGYLCDSVEDFAEKLEILIKSEQQRTSLGTKGKIYTEDNFDLKKIIGKYKELFK